MTSEVVLMNRLAVAMAADSAVSIDTGSGHKIFQSANKLFTLSKHRPVGAMIYNNAHALDVPWETITKLYRDTLGDRSFDKLSEYANDFLEWLDSNSFVFGGCSEEEHYFRDIKQYIQRIHNAANGDYFDSVMKGDGSKIEELISNHIVKAHGKLKKLEYSKSLPNRFRSKFFKKFSETIEISIAEVFKDQPLSKKDNQLLKDIAYWFVVKSEFYGAYSGIVFAGFGEKEIFPSMQSFTIGSPICGWLKCRKDHDKSITKDTSAVIVPFAQSDMINTFVNGIDPAFRRKMGWQTIRLAIGLPETVIDAIDDLTDKQKEKWKEKVKESVKPAMGEFFDEINDHQYNNHTIPVYQAIKSLPKDELASSAEALVSLNSFQKRVSMDAETVAGPIDVAVISKGDGFIWIRRKHYFEPELNYHFFNNYYVGADKAIARKTHAKAVDQTLRKRKTSQKNTT